MNKQENTKNSSTTPEERNDGQEEHPAPDDSLNSEMDAQKTKQDDGSNTAAEGTKVDRVSIADLQAEIQDLNSKYLYAMAEVDNTRKRHIKERSELLKYAGENLARDLLEVLDDLERAASQSKDVEGATVLEGVGLIVNRMKNLFERHGVKGEDCVGELFDPKKHEALTMAPSDSKDAGKILQQVSRCYFFKDKLLRPGQVIVGSGQKADDQGLASE